LGGLVRCVRELPPKHNGCIPLAKSDPRGTASFLRSNEKTHRVWALILWFPSKKLCNPPAQAAGGFVFDRSLGTVEYAMLVRTVYSALRARGNSDPSSWAFGGMGGWSCFLQPRRSPHFFFPCMSACGKLLAASHLLLDTLPPSIDKPRPPTLIYFQHCSSACEDGALIPNGFMMISKICKLCCAVLAIFKPF